MKDIKDFLINEETYSSKYENVSIMIPKSELKKLMNDVSGDDVYLLIEYNKNENGEKFSVQYDSSGNGKIGYFDNSGDKIDKPMTKFEKEHYINYWKPVVGAKYNKISDY